MSVRIAVIAATLSALAAAPLAAQPSPPAFTVPYEYFTLPNGLKVVVSPDRTAPVVLVEVMYNIGFRVEPKGRTGFAHLFEHMMFQGSGSLKKLAHVQLVSRAGGVLNGSTRFDYTNYFQVVPSNALDLTLWLEADRMRSLDLSPENLKNQQNVVSEEVRVNVLNQPHGGFEWLDLWEKANVNWHNAHNFYGDLSELEAATLDDVRAFFTTYYAPNNAVLVVVGDTTAAEVRALAEKHFGGIPRRAAPPSADVSEPPQTAEKRATRDDKLARTPALAVAWHLPPRMSRDFFALAVLDPLIVGDQSARLHQKLVRETRQATSVAGAFNLLGTNWDMKGPMLFTVRVDYRPDTTADKVIATVDEVLAEVRSQGITAAELAGAKRALRSAFLEDLEGGGLPRFGRANLLGAFALFDDDPGRINTILASLEAVTLDDVKAAAARWFVPANRTTSTAARWRHRRCREVSDEPALDTGRRDRRGDPRPRRGWRRGAAAGTAGGRRRARLRAAAARRTHAAQWAQGGRRAVRDGAEGVGVPHPAVGPGRGSCRPQRPRPVRGRCRAGRHGQPHQPAAARRGLRDGRVARRRGGAGLDHLHHARPGRDAAADARRAHRRRAPPDLPRLRGAAARRQRRSTGTGTAGVGLVRVEPPVPDRALRQPSLQPHRRHARVGEGDRPCRHRRLSRRALPAEQRLPGRQRRRRCRDGAAGRRARLRRVGAWRSRPAGYPAPPSLSGRRLVFVHRPGSVQSSISVGNITVKRDDPRWFMLQLANQIYGGAFDSRLMRNIREDKGYTYSPGSQFAAFADTGVYRAIADVRNEVTGATLKEIYAEMDGLRTAPPEAPELDGAVAYSRGLFVVQNATQNGLASTLNTVNTFGLPSDYPETFQARMTALAPEAVVTGARMLLASADSLVVVVGDYTKVKDQLAGFGEIQIVDVSGQPIAVPQ